jgi:hypothetical protein
MKLHCFHVTNISYWHYFSVTGVEVTDLYFAVMMKLFLCLVSLIYFRHKILLITIVYLWDKSAIILRVIISKRVCDLSAGLK